LNSLTSYSDIQTYENIYLFDIYLAKNGVEV
jgi:hypothetical protein